MAGCPIGRSGRRQIRQARGGFSPGMDIRAALTVVGDGPVGPVGRKLDEHFGLPEGYHQHDWAVGMKAVVELRPDCGLKPGRCFTRSAFRSRRFSGFCTCIPITSRRLGSLCRPGSTARCARLPLSAALDDASIPVALSAGGDAAFMGRENASGIGAPGRAALGGQRLCAYRRRIGQYQCFGGLRRG